MNMKTVSVKQIQALDRFAIDVLGIPSLSLMENAGRAVADEIVCQLRRMKGASVIIVCGAGNNGGDGLVAARHLRAVGVSPKVFVVGSGKAMSADAQANFNILVQAGFSPVMINQASSSFKRALSNADVVVDAIFGVGLNRDISGPVVSVIEAVNQSDAFVIATDIPSGLDGTNGVVRGICVKANVTVTFSVAKKGFYIKDGPRMVGMVKVVEIGIPLNTRRKSKN